MARLGGKPRNDACFGAFAGPSVQSHFVLLAYREFRDNKLNFFLGFLAVTAVVFVAALLASVLAKAPVLFTGLAEEANGEIDFIFEPASPTGRSFLNYTKTAELLSGPTSSHWEGRDDAYDFHSPRLTTNGKMYRASACGVCYPEKEWDPWDTTWQYLGEEGVNRASPEILAEVQAEYNYSKYTHREENFRRMSSPKSCYFPIRVPSFDCEPRYDVNDEQQAEEVPIGNSGFCFTSLCQGSTDVGVFGINSERERRMDLGYTWPYGPLGPGQAYVSKRAAKDLGVTVGEVIIVNVDAYRTMRGLWIEVFRDLNMTSETDWEKIRLTFEVIGIYEEIYGKHGIGSKRAIVVEYEYLFKTAVESLHPDIPSAVKEAFLRGNPQDYANQILVNFPPPRYDVYTHQDADVTVQLAVSFATDIVYRLGVQDLRVSMPVAESLRYYKYLSMFLGLMLNIVLFIFTFLSVILIYSLLSVSVERRSFSFGILRMVGLLKRDVIQMIVFQPLVNAFPAIALGLGLAYLGTFLVSEIFLTLTGVPLSVGLDVYAVALAVACGLFIPLLASVLPIQSALSMALTDAVDTKRSKVQAVQAQISRSSGGAISWTLVAFATSLVIFGFSIYYLMPLALLSTNISLLLNMFFGLIIMMLLGLVLLSLNIQHIMERVIVWSLFWWESRGIPQVLVKQLVAHRGRNRFTTVMYGLTIAFVIFIYVSYDINVKATLYDEQQSYGALFKVSGSTIKNRAALENFASRHSRNILDYTWASASVEDVSDDIVETKITHFGQLFHYPNRVFSVSPSFFEASLSQFLIVDDMADSSHDLLHQLYSSRGANSLLIGAKYSNSLALEPMSKFLFETRFATPEEAARDDSHVERQYTVSTLAFLSSCPNFFFSKFPLINSQHALVSIPTWYNIVRETDGNMMSLYDVPMSEFLIKVKDDMSDEETLFLTNELAILVQRLNRQGEKLDLYSFDENNDALEKADYAITAFFIFTTVMAMTICLFSLMSSMYTNVRENAKETGILRAIGVPRGWIFRLAIYEAFVIVFASSLVGAVIGTMVAYTMALQRVLFTEIPIPFALPWSLLLVVFVTSVVFAVLSTYQPVREVMGMRIVSLLRLLF